ncbi:MAG: hypothetical protein R3E02_00195 [Blastomonas sp.]
MKPIGIALAPALMLAMTGCANAQEADTDALYEELLAKINQKSTHDFVRDVALSYVDGFVEDHNANRPDEEPQWTSTDTRKSIDLFHEPVDGPIRKRIYASFAETMPVDDAKALLSLFADPKTAPTLDCALALKPDERDAAAWKSCAKSPARALDAEEQALTERAVDALTRAITLPAVNGAVGGMVCHTLDRFADRISKEGFTYSFGVTLRIGKAEPARACDVLKPRWSALAGLDAQLALEPEMIFKKDDDD